MLIKTMHLSSLTLVSVLLACGNQPVTLESEQGTKPIDSTSFALPEGKKDVLYYYQWLEEGNLKPDYGWGYPLVQKNGKWFSKSASTEEPIEAVVDQKNGFIEIVDPGTGGGDITVRFVLFRLESGAPVLGITHDFFDGTGINQQYYFLRPEDKEQFDWTEHTMPIITGFDFLPENNAEEPDIVEKLLPVSIELPHYGTTVKIKVFTGLEAIYCNGSENEYSDYCGLFNNLTRREFSLKWNKKEGRFE